MSFRFEGLKISGTCGFGSEVLAAASPHLARVHGDAQAGDSNPQAHGCAVKVVCWRQLSSSEPLFESGPATKAEDPSVGMSALN